MKKTAVALLLLVAIAPLAGAASRRQRAMRQRAPQQWQQPQCAQITGIPWIRFIDNAGRLVESVDPEVIWRQPVLTTESLALGATPNVLWAFTSDGGIHQSADAGCTWTEQARVPEVVANDDHWKIEPNMLAAGEGRVLVYKNDTLVRVTHGTVETIALPDRFIELASHPIDPSYLRAVAKYGAVYDSNDAGTTWHRRANPFAELRAAKIDPSNFDHILYGRTLGLYASSDAGVTVKLVTPEYSDLRLWQIEISPADPKVVWADGYDMGAATPRLLRSEDGGVTFTAEKRYNRVRWVAPTGMAAHPLERLTFAAQNNPGVRVIAPEGQRGEWIYGNYKKAVWSPAGTLYVLHQVVESR